MYITYSIYPTIPHTYTVAQRVARQLEMINFVKCQGAERKKRENIFLNVRAKQ